MATTSPRSTAGPSPTPSRPTASATGARRYFGINDKGNVMRPPGRPAARRASTSRSWSTRCARRGIGLPLLIRFSDILASRVVELNEAFRKAIAEYGYKGSYRGVYPIKVNQHRYVVERSSSTAGPTTTGSRRARKPELLAVMALLDDEEALIICNGYKDEEYIETALLASQARPQGDPRRREALASCR